METVNATLRIDEQLKEQAVKASILLWCRFHDGEFAQVMDNRKMLIVFWKDMWRNNNS